MVPGDPLPAGRASARDRTPSIFAGTTPPQTQWRRQVLGPHPAPAPPSGRDPRDRFGQHLHHRFTRNDQPFQGAFSLIEQGRDPRRSLPRPLDRFPPGRLLRLQ
ncbi:hypothetical protein CG747_36830 [Streptomyces sp. CB02959]|nr:hypothetical protein CG747_36830 [Streptomyces sp. CB02959]